MANIEIGSKLYSYVYGPMTVVYLDDQYVKVYLDHPEGISPNLNSSASSGHEKTFIIECIGQWIFTDPKDVNVKENNNFAVHQGQLPQSLVVNPNLFHAYYKNRMSLPVVGGESPVKVRGISEEESPVKVSNNEVFTGESPVKVRSFK